MCFNEFFPKFASVFSERFPFLKCVESKLAYFFVTKTVWSHRLNIVHRQTMLFSETIFGVFTQHNPVSYFMAT